MPQKLQKAFNGLEDLQNNSQAEVFKGLEAFICRMCSLKNTNNVIFMNNYLFKDPNNSFKMSTNNLDASILPACQS